MPKDIILNQFFCQVVCYVETAVVLELGVFLMPELFFALVV